MVPLSKLRVASPPRLAAATRGNAATVRAVRMWSQDARNVGSVLMCRQSSSVSIKSLSKRRRANEVKVAPDGRTGQAAISAARVAYARSTWSRNSSSRNLSLPLSGDTAKPFCPLALQVDTIQDRNRTPRNRRKPFLALQNKAIRLTQVAKGRFRLAPVPYN